MSAKAQQQEDRSQPCASLVVRLVNQLVLGVPIEQTTRVEVRRCDAAVSGSLQIVAWESGALKPSLVIDTTDFTVVQAAGRQNAFVIETTGGPRDRVYVVLYEDGKPTLKLKQVTKGTARVTLQRDSLDLVINGTYAGNLPPRTETYHYTLQ